MTISSLSQMEYEFDDFYIAHRFNIFNKKDVLSKHIHDCYEVIFVKKGEFKYFFEDTSLTVTDGDLLITPPHIYHYFEATNTSRCERYVLLVRGESLQNLITVNKPSKINILNNDILRSIYNRFDYYSSNFKKEQIQINVKSLIGFLVNELIINLSLVDEFDNDNVNFSTPILSSIVKYINENLHTIPTTSVVIEKFNISESYLHKLFKKYLKITPKHYLVLKKMSLAKKLINDGVALTEVSRQCGFSSYTAFYRTFINYYKVNPAKMVE